MTTDDTAGDPTEDLIDDRVSVVIPTYDRAYCVGEAVQSVLDQSHRSIECLVVDDGSRDGTVAALHESFGSDPRVRLLEQDHGGVSRARNLGVDHATGRYVTFLDSDDLMVPHRIELQLRHLRDAVGVDGVIGRQQQVLVGVGRPAWLARHPEWWDAPYHMSLLVETRRLRAIGGFDPALSVGEDLDLMVRLSGAGLRIAALDDVVVIRRYFGDNATYAMDDDDRGAILAAVRRHRAGRSSTTVPAPGSS